MDHTPYWNNIFDREYNRGHRHFTNINNYPLVVRNEFDADEKAKQLDIFPDDDPITIYIESLIPLMKEFYEHVRNYLATNKKVLRESENSIFTGYDFNDKLVSIARGFRNSRFMISKIYVMLNNNSRKREKILKDILKQRLQVEYDDLNKLVEMVDNKTIELFGKDESKLIHNIIPNIPDIDTEKMEKKIRKLKLTK